MPGSIQSLERAAAILRLLAGDDRRLGLSDVATSLGLAKGTAHGLLRTLQQEGLVEQEPGGKYQLGAELLRLGNSYLDVHELRARALVWTDDLARSSGEAAYLGVLHHRGVLIVHHVFRPDDSRQVLEVGAMQPLHSTALGKVLSAFDRAAHDEAVEGERAALTARTVTGPHGLRDRAGADPGPGLGRRPGGDLGGRGLDRRARLRPAPDTRGRGGHHRRGGADVRPRGRQGVAGRGRTGLRACGLARPGRRALLRTPSGSRGPSGP